MSLQVIVQNFFDITDRVTDTGAEDFSTTREVFTTSRRIFPVIDSDGFLDPFGTDGILSNGWRNKSIKIIDGDETLYDGLIQDVRQIETDNQLFIEIESVSTFGSILEFAVDAAAKITSYQVDGFHGKGSTSIKLKTGTETIPSLAIFSPSNTLAPNYQIFSVTGNTIKLDRAIEADLADNTAVIISTPQNEPPAYLIKQALQSALAFVNQLDKLDTDAFDALADKQAAGGISCWTIVRAEDGMSGREYIGKITGAFSLYIKENDTGQVSIAEGPGVSGFNPLKSITDDVIPGAPSATFNRDQLVYAYNCFYVENETVKNETAQLSELDPSILEFSATAVFTPFQADDQGNLVSAKILYGNQATAQAEGNKVLNYYKTARKRWVMPLGKYDAQGTEFALKQFDEVLLNFSINAGESYSNQAARVMSLNYDDRQNQYVSVTVEI